MMTAFGRPQGGHDEMVRRSFRFGLRLGLLAGVGFAVFKMLQSRRPAAPEFTPQPAPWPPAPVAKPAAPPQPAAAPAPTAAAPKPAASASPAPAAPVSKATEPPKPAAPKVTPSEAPPARQRPLVAKKAPAKKGAPSAPSAPAGPWVAASGAVCPPSHPVKAKLASKIFHTPGQLAYDRTVPDRCYKDADAASADGLRQAKR
jgi:hypothetical protein